MIKNNCPKNKEKNVGCWRLLKCSPFWGHVLLLFNSMYKWRKTEYILGKRLTKERKRNNNWGNQTLNNSFLDGKFEMKHQIDISFLNNYE